MRRVVRKSLIFLLLFITAAGGAWFAHRASAKAAERRYLEQAEDELEQRDFGKATLCLHRVLELNPGNVEAITKMAELLDAQGMPGAVHWRARAAQLQPKDTSLRFYWAQAALKAQEPRSAEQALQGLDETARTTAQYHKLAGALDWSLGRSDAAENHYQQALQFEPTNQTVAFNLAAMRLRSTNSVLADAARLSMEQVTNNPELKMTALRQLLVFEDLRKSPDEALKYSLFIVKDPAASYADKLEHLELLHQVKSNDLDSWLTELKQAATNSSTRAFALGKWMTKVNGPASSLVWIRSLPEEVQSSPPLAFLVADCYVQLRDWPALVETIESQNWGEEDPRRMALLALAQSSLGQAEAWPRSWHEALREAEHHLDTLMSLVRLTSSWGWDTQRTEVLELISAEFPQAKLAAERTSQQGAADDGASRATEARL